MSAAIAVRIQCDQCRSMTAKPLDSAYRARRYYHAFGWRRSGGRDLCPTCRAAR